MILFTCRSLDVGKVIIVYGAKMSNLLSPAMVHSHGRIKAITECGKECWNGVMDCNWL